MWVIDEVIPYTSKVAVGHIAQYFARHGHLSREDGLPHADRHLIPAAVNLSVRYVYETLGDMVDTGLLNEYQDQGTHVLYLNLAWVSRRKRDGP